MDCAAIVWGMERKVGKCTGKDGLWRNPGLWLGSSIATIPLLVLTWLFGAFSGGLAVAETCALSGGTHFDASYRERLGGQPSGPFPLHNMCNASYDLVPGWVNPALVCLAVIFAGSLVAAIVTGIAQRRHVPSERRGAEV